MADTSYLKWPFFEPHHARLAQSLDAWATQNIAHAHEHHEECDHDHFHMTHPDTEWKSCIEHAVKIGLGTNEYDLETI